MDTNATLHRAIQGALDGLLRALELEPVGADRYRAHAEPGRFDRVFGGQTLAQALLAAAATVRGKAVHSLHACFAQVGTPDGPLELLVERVRDGRSIAIRRVTALQGERPLLSALASFHANASGPTLAGPAPPAPAAETLPALQDWVHELPTDRREIGRPWVERPPPLELRIGEPPNFLGGPSRAGARSHWMRLPRDVGDDDVLHAALLTYASDYLLLDMAYRSHPEPITPGAFSGFSLDHAIWLHRPVRLDRWHLHTQETIAIVGHRGLVRGAIHDAAGELVATVMQEALVRPNDAGERP
jgi:acyl-CoA thioesterase-2